MFMAYMGRSYFFSGNYTYYFSIIGVSLLVILLLHLSLKRKERLREKYEQDNAEYGTYNDDKTTESTDKPQQ